MNILEARKIYKSYGNKFNKQEVLSGIDLTIEAGGICQYYGAIRLGENNSSERIVLYRSCVQRIHSYCRC
ncbi:ABC-type dipeptide/oligopeptide/nickel transport system ATPase subunit [Bacillus sp. TBS-096]|nr:ABC-type dipeptide/oligopeptide/nickel transport system ATPase subunit [Bacillus sp. TBS-096]